MFSASSRLHPRTSSAPPPATAPHRAGSPPERPLLSKPVLWALLLLQILLLTTRLRAIAAITLALSLILLFIFHRQRHASPRLRLSLSRGGQLLIALTLGLGLAAINTGNNMLYLLLGTLLSLILTSGVLSAQMLRGLSVTRQQPAEVHAGQPFLTSLWVHNRKPRVPSFSIQVEDQISGIAQSKKCYFLKVPAQNTQRAHYRARIDRRGLYHYQRLRVGTRFPFSFFMKYRYIEASSELLVLPQISAQPALSLPAAQPFGVRTRARVGQSQEFHALRAWREGEDVRAVHWARSAREGRLLLREYEEEARHRVVLVLNPGIPPTVDPQDERLDALVNLTASLLQQLFERRYEAALLLGDRPLTVGQDATRLREAMRQLARFAFEPWHGEPATVPPFEPHTSHLLLSHSDSAAAYAGRPFLLRLTQHDAASAAPNTPEEPA